MPFFFLNRTFYLPSLTTGARKHCLFKTERCQWSGRLTPQLVVVAAALRLATAVPRLADVALVVHAITVQETLRETSRGHVKEECIFTVSTFKQVKHLEALHQAKQNKTEKPSRSTTHFKTGRRVESRHDQDRRENSRPRLRHSVSVGVSQSINWFN